MGVGDGVSSPILDALVENSCPAVLFWSLRCLFAPTYRSGCFWGVPVVMGMLCRAWGRCVCRLGPDLLPPRRSLSFFAGGGAPGTLPSITSPSSSVSVGVGSGGVAAFVPSPSCLLDSQSWGCAGGASADADFSGWKKRVSGGVCPGPCGGGH